MTAVLPSQAQPAVGSTIDRAGKYRLGELLGEGGMARVYRGAIISGEGFQREVAIKVVLPSFSANPVFYEMFKNEAWLASLLHHDNIVAALDFDRGIDGNVFQVLEYVHGRDLEKLSLTGPVPMPVAAYIMGEVLRGLAHAHSATAPNGGKLLLIVHRDCTPSNVLLTYDGRVKVSDFGVAKAMHATNATQSGTAKGKPAYMSPEQLEGALDLDGRSDLFAVGVMLWELLAGRHLFVKATDTQESVIGRVLMYGKGLEPLEDLGQINPLVPAGLHQLVHSLLAPRRQDRPVDAASTLARLRPWIPPDGAEQLAALMANRFPKDARRPGGSAELVTVHGSYGPAGTSIAPQSTTAATAGELAKARRAGRQSRWPLAIALGAVGMVAIVSGIVLATGSGDKPADTAAATGEAAATAATPLIDAAVAMTRAVDAGATVPSDPQPPLDAMATTPTDAGAPAVDAGKRTRPRGTRGDKRGSDEQGNFVEYDLGGSGK